MKARALTPTARALTPARDGGPDEGRPDEGLPDEDLARIDALDWPTIERDLDAPAIAGEVAVGAHHAMAGNRDRKRVGAAGLRDRAHSFRLTDRARNLLVGRRLAGRDGAQSHPHLLLERGAADVEGKIQALTRRLDETDHLRHHALEFGLAPFELRAREAVL